MAEEEQEEQQEEEEASSAATKVQKAAASVQDAAAKRRGRITPGKSEAEMVVRRYFEAIGAHDVQGAAAMWAPDGREDVRGQGLFIGPDGVREFIGSLVEAIPDLKVEIVSTTSEDERCALQWRFSGTFAGPGSFNGVAPTGHRLELEGVDILTVRDGLIHSNDAFTDTMAVPRQLGMMPPLGSGAEQRMMGAFNVKTRVSDGLMGAGEAKLVAEGVWVVQGQPGRCNVYFIENTARRRRDDVRRGRAHDDPRGGAGGGAARRDHPDRARARAHRPPRHRAGAGRARGVPPRGGPGRRGQRRVALLAGRPRGAAAGAAPDP